MLAAIEASFQPASGFARVSAFSRRGSDMKDKRTFFKWGVLTVVVLVALTVAAWALSRAIYPTDAQREAVAEMALPDYSGRNAFALLWSLDRDVPEDEIDEVLAEDVQRFSETSFPGEAESSGAWDFESSATKYADLTPSSDDMALFCRSREESCIERVREDLDAYKALMERNRKLLDRAEQLHEYDYLALAFPHRIDAPMPPFQSASLLRTRRAVAFVDGQQEKAIEETCRDISTWRRLGERSDNLIARMISAAYTTNLYGRTLANMLAEWPVDRPLPESCEDALAPPTVAEVSICEALRGEFALVSFGNRELHRYLEQSNLYERLVYSLLFDPEATNAMTAEYMQATCSDEEAKRLRADSPDIPAPQNRSLWRFACVGNPIGCMSTAITPDLTDYRHRVQDYGAKLRVLGTLAWMRRHTRGGRSPAGSLASCPEDFKSPSRDIEFGPEGRTLRVALYEEREDEYWSIPLPPSLYHERGR
jgi:hypothetical protein